MPLTLSCKLNILTLEDGNYTLSRIVHNKQAAIFVLTKMCINRMRLGTLTNEAAPAIAIEWAWTSQTTTTVLHVKLSVQTEGLFLESYCFRPRQWMIRYNNWFQSRLLSVESPLVTKRNSKFALCHHILRVFVCFEWLPQQVAIITVGGIHHSVFITVTACVLCKVGN